MLLEQALSSPLQNTAGLLPDPIKPAATLTSGEVVADIREHRESDQLNLQK